MLGDGQILLSKSGATEDNFGKASTLSTLRNINFSKGCV